MGFSLNDGIVEGNLFNRRGDGWSGKWKYTVAINMSDYWSGEQFITPVHAVLWAVHDGKADGVIQSVWAPLRRLVDRSMPIDETQPHLPDDGYWLVVPLPYHQHAYPVMVAV